MAIEQHIEELRSELLVCDEPAERAQIRAEIEVAQAWLAELLRSG